LLSSLGGALIAIRTHVRAATAGEHQAVVHVHMPGDLIAQGRFARLLREKIENIFPLGRQP
jgi:hypothetical protein